MSPQERDSSDVVQQLPNELQLVIEEREESMMHDMRKVMSELIRNNGPPASSSAEGSADVRASPRGAEPAAVRGNGAEDRGVANKGLHPLLRQDKFLLLVLLLPEEEREDIQQQQERGFLLKMPRVVWE